MSKDEFIDAHHSSLYLHQLCLNWEHHDVVFVCSDGVKVPAHKLILLSRSHFCKTMFASGTYSDKNPVNFPYSSECLKKILGFLYSGKLNLKDTDFRVLLEIMDASRMMLMNSIYDDIKCGVSHFVEDYIIGKLFGIPEDDFDSDDEVEETVDDEDNSDGAEEIVEIVKALSIETASKFNQVVDVLNYSITNRFPTLMNASICFLKDEALLFLQSEAFSKVSFLALSELLSLDALADSSEVGIFKAVFRWLNSSQEHMDLKDNVFELIRFEDMSVFQLIDTVMPTGLLEDKELLMKVESIVRKDKSKDGNGRRVAGRWGCMEKASRVPMWIREVGGQHPKCKPCPFYASGYCEYQHHKHRPLTELGLGFLQLIQDEEPDDSDYVFEEDTAEESDYTTDEGQEEIDLYWLGLPPEDSSSDHFSEEDEAEYKNPLESQEKLDAYIRDR